MLNYKTSIKGDITYSDLEIKEIKPIMKLIVRGKTKEFMTAIGKNLNMLLTKEANTFTSTNIFQEDVTFDGATAGGDVVFDRSENALEFADDDKAKVGASDDLQLFHAGGENFIRGTASTSPLYIDCCQNLNIRHLDTDGSNTEDMIKAIADGAVELYHNNIKKSASGYS